MQKQIKSRWKYQSWSNRMSTSPAARKKMYKIKSTENKNKPIVQISQTLLRIIEDANPLRRKLFARVIFIAQSALFRRPSVFIVITSAVEMD